jgi:hypothetical protein
MPDLTPAETKAIDTDRLKKEIACLPLALDAGLQAEKAIPNILAAARLYLETAGNSSAAESRLAALEAEREQIRRLLAEARPNIAELRRTVNADPFEAVTFSRVDLPALLALIEKAEACAVSSLMPGEKIVTVRKQRDCCHCDIPIQPGEKARFSSHKSPRYADDHETQIGIQFQKFWQHHDSGCAEEMVIQWRGKTMRGNPFFWGGEWWDQVVLEIDGTETRHGRCFYAGKTLQEAMTNLINDEQIDPEWEERRRDVY